MLNSSVTARRASPLPCIACSVAIASVESRSDNRDCHCAASLADGFTPRSEPTTDVAWERSGRTSVPLLRSRRMRCATSSSWAIAEPAAPVTKSRFSSTDGGVTGEGAGAAAPLEEFDGGPGVAAGAGGGEELSGPVTAADAEETGAAVFSPPEPTHHHPTIALPARAATARSVSTMIRFLEARGLRLLRLEEADSLDVSVIGGVGRIGRGRRPWRRG